jgi:hypothetical protein
MCVVDGGWWKDGGLLVGLGNLLVVVRYGVKV